MTVQFHKTIGKVSENCQGHTLPGKLNSTQGLIKIIQDQGSSNSPGREKCFIGLGSPGLLQRVIIFVFKSGSRTQSQGSQAHSFPIKRKNEALWFDLVGSAIMMRRTYTSRTSMRNAEGRGGGRKDLPLDVYTRQKLYFATRKINQ